MDRMHQFMNVPTSKRTKQTFNRKLKFNIATKYCLSYCRTGRCVKGTKCLFVHDVDKIAACIQFIYGKCKTPNCSLSHNLTPAKMPDCSFFLKGCCKVENCNYRHVKVGKDAVLCKDFLTGYCPKGIQCENSHLFICKTYNKTGKCPKGSKCTLAHQNMPGIKNFRANSEFSKFKKVNTNHSTKSNKQQKPSTDTTTVHEMPSSQREILYSLLTKRLRTASESNKQIVSKPDSHIDGSTDYIPLSAAKVSSSSSDDFFVMRQMNGESKGKSARTQSSQALKRKYFIIDSDEEKISDYLSTDSLRQSENICRPQLKIMPDFLMNK